jgi:hypothetical protein
LIVDGISLDLGLTAKELLKWFGERVNDVVIIDIDIEGGTSSVSVELESADMVTNFKKLDGTYCLGERISVRKIGEETTKTSA